MLGRLRLIGTRVLCGPDERCVETRITVDGFERTVHFNLAAMHSMISIPIPDLEAAVHSD